MNRAERRVAWVASTAHLLTHATMTLLPGVLVVLAGEQSLGFFSLGAVVNLGYFLFGLGSIPAGMLVDRLGARKVLELGLWGMGLSSILTGLAPSALTFAVAYGCVGLAASLYHPAGLALIAKHVVRRGGALSLHGILGNIGLSLAPLFAGLLASALGTWRAPYLALGTVVVACAVLVRHVSLGEPSLAWADFRRAGAAWARSGPAAPPEPATVSLSLVVLSLGAVVFGLVYRGSLTYLPALLQQEVAEVARSAQPVVTAGGLASAILALGVVGQWLGGVLSDRLARPEAGHAAIFLAVIPAVYLMGRLNDGALVGACAVFTMAFYGWQPLQNALVANLTTRSTHGRGYGLNFFLIMGMGSVATVAGGYLAQTYGVFSVYRVLAWVSAAGLLVALLVGPSRRYVIRFQLTLRKRDGDGQ